MANQEHLDILKQGVEVWNQWRKEHIETRYDFREADLRGADLNHANLSRSTLYKANLSSANLRNATLSGANLERANLSEAELRLAYLVDANLSNADLSNADLSNVEFGTSSTGYTDINTRTHVREVDTVSPRYPAKLAGANLAGANLFGVNLTGVDLTGANLSWALVGLTIFGDLDLRAVKGLETISHEGPSTIGIDTIYRSKGNIPEAFLKGAGIDDNFITYIRSLVGKAIEYYSCFISYSSKDEAFAKRLYIELHSNNVRCWFAPEDLKIGDKFRHRIDSSIRMYDKLLLVLSEASLASTWVGYEVEKALDKEPEGIPNVLFPIRLDKAILTCETDWAKDIRKSRHIGDFEHWKDHDAYQIAFERLLRDLKSQS